MHVVTNYILIFRCFLRQNDSPSIHKCINCSHSLIYYVQLDLFFLIPCSDHPKNYNQYWTQLRPVRDSYRSHKKKQSPSGIIISVGESVRVKGSGNTIKEETLALWSLVFRCAFRSPAASRVCSISTLHCVDASEPPAFLSVSSLCAWIYTGIRTPDTCLQKE